MCRPSRRCASAKRSSSALRRFREIGRSTGTTKQAYTDGVLAFIDDIAARLAPHDPPSARVKTLSVYAQMIGTLQLARALADRQLADEILEQGIHNALAVLDAK